MVNRSCARALLGTSLAAGLLTTAAADVARADEGPRRDEEPPTAGASYYLHFGPWGGLCTRSFDEGVGAGQVVHDEAAKVLYIRGRSDAETFVDIGRDDKGTSDAWDDELVVTMTVYADGPDSTEVFTMPYFDTTGGGGIGGFTTKNEPQDTAVGFIYYRGSTDSKNALTNRTSMPTRADGWFTVLAGGEDGFTGGGGPECVTGSNQDDRLFTGGGDDYARGKYGNDLIVLGEGNDTTDAGSDDDTMRGGRGNDELRGGGGSDCYDGGAGADILEDEGNSFQDMDSYMIDEASEDYITTEWPFMVDDCM